MKYLNVGIAYEGGNDNEVIAAVVRRVMEEKGYTFDYFRPSSHGTMIIPFVPAYVRDFISNDIDIGVFCTDQDEDDEPRYGLIRSKIEDTDSLFLNNSIIATPSPNIEAWLLLDDATVKNILHLDASKPLPYDNLPSKSRFVELYNEAKDYSGSQNNLRITIAELMNLRTCCQRDANFRKFFDDIVSAINLKK